MVYTVIGMNSFLAQSLKECAGTQGWNFLSHKQVFEQSDWLKTCSGVINFAFSPEMAARGYNSDLDIDSKIAELITEREHIRYTMVSTRKVYGTFNEPLALREDMELNPDTSYGQAKKEVEQRLSDILPVSRLTILRPSNIFGKELHRKTFFGYALTRLVTEGKIVYDFNPHVSRDFLSVEKFAQCVVHIMNNPKGGIYNIGAGFGVECGKIVQWLIEGYGQGELVVSDNIIKDAFSLDMTKTNAEYDLKAYTSAQLQADCLAVARFYKEINNSILPLLCS